MNNDPLSRKYFNTTSLKSYTPVNVIIQTKSPLAILERPYRKLEEAIDRNQFRLRYEMGK